MNLQPDSKILFQGITAELSATHGVQMKVYGTKVVAGVNPGLGGQTFDDIPVFDLVEQALAENMSIKVVAEGIETKEQLAKLRALKCQYGQGYFFSKPLDNKAIEDLLATQSQW